MGQALSGVLTQPKRWLVWFRSQTEQEELEKLCCRCEPLYRWRRAGITREDGVVQATREGDTSLRSRWFSHVADHWPPSKRSPDYRQTARIMELPRADSNRRATFVSGLILPLYSASSEKV